MQLAMPQPITSTDGHRPDLLDSWLAKSSIRPDSNPEFRILGSLEMRHGSASYRPRGPKVRKLLALLIVRANDTVTVDHLIDELWEGDPCGHGGEHGPHASTTCARSSVSGWGRTRCRAC